MIDIKNVSFSYTGQEEAKNLRDINLKVEPGECVLLCGESGCGKTTITKLINGLIPHFCDGELKGSTTVGDMAVEQVPLYKLSQKVGSVFQNPKSQFFNLDSDNELAFGLENNGVASLEIRRRINETVKQLDIEHLLHKNIFEMSGGEKQSLAFASVYAMNPDVYVLDEPSANLDYMATENLKKQIAYVKARGKTVIVAEHRLHYLRDLIDRVVFIENGQIKREFSAAEFLGMSEESRHELGLRTLMEQQREIGAAAESKGELEVRNLTVKYKGKKIFENLSFAVSKGTVLGILGHNGAGKSTLIRCISGLLKESSGEICYEGKKLSRKERNRLCYMIMQDVNHQLFAESVWNECRISCKDQEASGKEKTEKALAAFGLLQLKDRHPMALSGGQKQRLAIATGMLAGKKVIMFDEPSSGLDYKHMLMVSKNLRQLAQDGYIVMVVTHDMELLNSACDRVLNL